MVDASLLTNREISIAKVLRPLGKGVMTIEQAKRAAQLLDVRYTTVYRLRAKFLRESLTSSLTLQKPGPKIGGGRLDAEVEQIISDVIVKESKS